MNRSCGPIIFLVIAMLGPVALQGQSYAASGGATPPSEHWELVWQDEFEGKELDPTNWTIVLMPDPYNNELQSYPDRPATSEGANVRVENGTLIIEARREDFEHRKFTSARLNTKGKREFLYGRFEARLRLPAEVGLWPAFWMLGANIGEVGWPACGEIDIVEGKGRLPNWTSGALHRGPDPSANKITSQEYELPSGDFHADWHLFAVEWEPEQIRWFVDEVSFFTVDKPADVESADWPFDHGHPFFLILNLALGGWFDNPHMPPDDLQPQHLLVDYVRVYRNPRIYTP